MKFLTLLGFCAVLAAATALNFDAASGYRWYHGQKNTYDDKMKWMMVADDNGKQQLAILNGPKSVRPIAIADDVLFYLYTKSNINNGYKLLVGDNANLNASPYNGGLPTKFIIHGYTNDITSPIIQDLKNAYLAAGSYNVIGVDWGVLAAGPLYNIAADNTVPAGNYVARMVNHLITNGGSTLGRTHLVGHSLGAHVSGIAAAAATGIVGRVTGLDAALPLFDSRPNSERLDRSDASFVDSIHTCGGWLGFRDPVGHADFYPNGGEASQPGCGADATGSCSHGKAYEYMDASIRNHQRYPAHKCNSLADASAGTCAVATSGYMGEGATSAQSGFYWMATT